MSHASTRVLYYSLYWYPNTTVEARGIEGTLCYAAHLRKQMITKRNQHRTRVLYYSLYWYPNTTVEAKRPVGRGTSSDLSLLPRNAMLCSAVTKKVDRLRPYRLIAL
ncbi:hypothetical protein U9M48_025099 [Paspalum notatum var. saurae]|uniref:Uncharacterized protein n=1 Tax=Paspalum notatum var. saurae TaxID=547442 RepID=A0AAQ3TU99_PASNO